MPLSTAISLASCAVAVLSLVFARRDRQSAKSSEALRAHQDEMDRLGRKIESNERDINGLRLRIVELEKENRELRDENMRLMKIVINCPAPNCPVISLPRDLRQTPDGYRGVNRRARESEIAWAEGVVQGRELERRETGKTPVDGDGEDE
jgi:hypothetical protein